MSAKKIDLEEIYDQHSEALYRFFYFKVLNKPLAEDLTSQTFTKFVESAQKTSINDPTNFLYGIGRNVFNNYLRDKYKEKQVHLDDLDNFTEVMTDTPGRGASLEERALPHIEQLPDSQRRVAYMRLIEKQTNAEIAASLHRSSGYVKTTLRRALRSLESSAGTFRSKVPFILLFIPMRGGQSFFRLLTESAATPDPAFITNLKAGVVAGVATGGAVGSEAAGIAAKAQSIIKTPVGITGAGATTATVAIAAVLALSQNTQPPIIEEPVVPQNPNPTVSTPQPNTPTAPEPLDDDPAVASTQSSPSTAVLGATTDGPVLPTIPAIAPKTPIAETPDVVWKAEFWILERFNLSEIPEIPDRLPDHVRTDESINFNWGFRSPAPDIEFPRNHFAVRWTKTELFEDPGMYQFTTTSDDGVRAYVDDEVVIDNWNSHRTETNTATVKLDAGLHELRVEYYDNNVEAEISFDYIKTDNDAPTDNSQSVVEPIAAEPKQELAIKKPISPRKPLTKNS